MKQDLLQQSEKVHQISRWSFIPVGKESIWGIKKVYTVNQLAIMAIIFMPTSSVGAYAVRRASGFYIPCVGTTLNRNKFKEECACVFLPSDMLLSTWRKHINRFFTSDCSNLSQRRRDPPRAAATLLCYIQTEREVTLFSLQTSFLTYHNSWYTLHTSLNKMDLSWITPPHTQTGLICIQHPQYFTDTSEFKASTYTTSLILYISLRMPNTKQICKPKRAVTWVRRTAGMTTAVDFCSSKANLSTVAHSWRRHTPVRLASKK